MLIVLYLAAIVAANLLVAQFGPSVTVLNAFLFIGFDISTRDRLHERWQYRHLARNMGLLIVAGGVISYALNTAALQIALASCVAFIASESVDTLIYAALHRYPRWIKMNGSNVVSAAVDSIVFPTLAFGIFIPAVVLGQFAAKVVGGAIWAWVLTRKRVRTAVDYASS